MITVYINNFLLIFKLYISIDQIKKNHKNEYNIKNLGEIEMIIDQQMIQNRGITILKIKQLVFIYNLFKENILRDYNTINIPMKTCNFIEMTKENDYEKANIKIYY